MNLALNLPGGSPDRRTAGFNTPGKKDQKNVFPTTPRSVEKQKKILQARLKRLMEHNFRLNAQNQVLNTNSKQLLLQAVVSITWLANWMVGCGNAQQVTHGIAEQGLSLS